MRPRCAQYRKDPGAIARGHPRSVDRHLKRKHSRLKERYNFLATLHEAVCDGSDSDQLKNVDEVSSPSVEPERLQSPQPYDLSHTLSTSPTSQTSPASVNPSETNSSTSTNIIGDVLSRLPLATANHVDNSIPLDDLPCGRSAQILSSLDRNPLRNYLMHF